MIKKLFSPRTAVWALDFGHRHTTALAGAQEVSGAWTLLGRGRTRSMGREHGEISKLSDVVESVTEALRQAEKGAGLRCKKLYYNFDDAMMSTVHPVGSKALPGEGQIRREDVREAARNASRMADDFNRSPVYAREVSYLIDGKDTVGDPLGVYGHRLDVTLHVVLSRASVAEQWKSVMRRAQVERFAPILSLDSVCRAVLDRSPERRIVWDLGDDFISGGVSERGALREYRIFLSDGLDGQALSARVDEISRQWVESRGVSAPLVLTGDRAEAVATALESVVAGPERLAGFESPSDSAVAGLLEAASQRERRIATVRTSGQWAKQARERANAFIQEYF